MQLHICLQGRLPIVSSGNSCQALAGQMIYIWLTGQALSPGESRSIAIWRFLCLKVLQWNWLAEL